VPGPAIRQALEHDLDRRPSLLALTVAAMNFHREVSDTDLNTLLTDLAADYSGLTGDGLHHVAAGEAACRRLSAVEQP
jgi:hypothetical protein